MAASSTPPLSARIKVINANLLAMRRLAALYADPASTRVRTPQTDESALRVLQAHASEIWDHIQAETELSSRFERPVCVLLYRLALGHHVRLYMRSQDSNAAGRSSEPSTQWVPLAVTHPYQRPADTDKRETSAGLDDVPAAISASLSALHSNQNDALSQLLGSVTIADLVPGSLDDVCVQLSETSLIASTPDVSDHAVELGSYPVHLASIPLGSPSIPASSGGLRTPSSRSLRMNPLDRAGRQKRPTTGGGA